MRTFLPSGPSGPSAGPPPGWGVRRAARLAFPGPASLAADPGHTGRLRVYLADMLAPYGLALDEGALARGGQSYGEMAEALIRAAVPPGERVDLLVLAHRVPDITPGRATATWLSHACPGRPLAFAVTDPSPAAAFTALRLTRAYAAGAGLERALLLVVEQPSLPFTPGTPPALPDTSYGVALLLGPRAPGERPPAAVRSEPGLTAAAAGAPGEVTVVLGPSLAASPPLTGAAHVRRAPAHRPTTGVWWELAEELAAPDAAPPRRVVLAEAAPPPGAPAAASAADLAVAAFDISGAPLAATAHPAGRQR